MKILYHHRTRAGDAQGIHIREITRAMEDLGHIVRIASIAKGSSSDTRGTDKSKHAGASRKNASLYEVMTLAYNVFGIAMLARESLMFKPDMIYERYSLNTFCGILISKLFRIPLVLEVNAPLTYEQKKYERLAFQSLATALERWICSSATKTIVVSKVMKEMLEANGVPPSHIVVVPNGINPEEFNPEVPCDDIRRQWNIEGKTILGFVGWFKKWHGLESVIELYAENGWRSENLQLFFVGDGPARSDLEKIADRCGVSSNVTITGSVPREKIPAYISVMDIALQPSAPEYASPIKIFEYMGMGKCIVAPDQPNIRELIEDGKTGLLFQPGNKSEMGEVLRKAIDSRDLRSRLGSNARQEIFDKGYLWQRNAERAIELVFPGDSAVERNKGR